MPYQVDAVPFGETGNGETAALFSITNSAGSRLEISNYGCRVVSATVCCGGERRRVVSGLPTLSDYERSAQPVGAVLLEADGQPLDTSHTVWQVAELGDNSVSLFQKIALPPGGEASFVVRFAWMDHERLVIDVSGSCDRPFAPAAAVEPYFTLAEDNQGTYQLREFCSAPADGGGLSQPDAPRALELPCDRVITAENPSGGLRPMAELICPESDLTLTAYTTAAALRICSVTEPFPAMKVRLGTAGIQREGIQMDSVLPGQFWNQRMIYGIDAIYHGPKRVLPFGL